MQTKMADFFSPHSSDDSDEESASDALLEPDDDFANNFLFQYDPFHDVTVAISAPGPDSCQLGPSLAPLGVSALVGSEAPRTLRAVAQASAQPCPGIDYQDFAPEIDGLDEANPRCSQRFSDLVQRANSWLNQNPHMRVRTCETVTWCTYELRRLGDTESVITHSCSQVTPASDNYITVGLRLWVRIAEDNSPPQVLHYLDLKSQPSQSLTDLVRTANTRIRNDKTTGDVISAETLLVPGYQCWNTADVFWRQTQHPPSSKQALFLRIFYAQHTRRLPVLGVKNIVPGEVSGHYESYSQLMQRASKWITQQDAVQLLNLKSVLVNKSDSECSEESAESCSHHWRQYNSEQYIQILRLFYTHTPPHAPPTLNPSLSCMTFTPVQTTLGTHTSVQFEKLKQTMIRITAWLELADAEIRCMETLITPFIVNSPNHALPEVMNWRPSLLPAPNAPITPFLFHFRVYLQGDYKEPDLSLLPPLPYSLASAHYAGAEAYHRKDPTSRRKRKFRIKIYVVVANVVLLIVGLVVFTLFYFNQNIG